MSNKRSAVIHFLDGTKLALEWPKQAPEDAVQFAAMVRKAIQAEQWAVEVDGSLLIIQTRNVKYIAVTPAPEKLPGEILRHARFVE